MAALESCWRPRALWLGLGHECYQAGSNFTQECSELCSERGEMQMYSQTSSRVSEVEDVVRMAPLLGSCPVWCSLSKLQGQMRTGGITWATPRTAPDTQEGEEHQETSNWAGMSQAGLNPGNSCWRGLCAGSSCSTVKAASTVRESILACPVPLCMMETPLRG